MSVRPTALSPSPLGGEGWSEGGIDPARLDHAIGQVNVLLASHGGGIEAEDIDADGTVRLRFVGMCCGCPCKPLTMLATVTPLIERVPGVTAVTAAGARISEEAARRLVELGIAPVSPTLRQDPAP